MKGTLNGFFFSDAGYDLSRMDVTVVINIFTVE